MASRHKERILAFQALYAWDMADDDRDIVLKDLLDFSWVEMGAVDFSRLLAAGTVENIKTVDALIRKNLVHWDFSRLSRVDRALLRVSVYEMLFKTAPPSVVIDEAVDISREFGSDDSYRFINGVLDGVRKTIQEKENTK